MRTEIHVLRFSTQLAYIYSFLNTLDLYFGSIRLLFYQTPNIYLKTIPTFDIPISNHRRPCRVAPRSHSQKDKQIANPEIHASSAPRRILPLVTLRQRCGTSGGPTVSAASAKSVAAFWFGGREQGAQASRGWSDAIAGYGDGGFWTDISEAKGRRRVKLFGYKKYSSSCDTT